MRGEAVTVTFASVREVREHLVLDAVEREHLEAGAASSESRGC